MAYTLTNLRDDVRNYTEVSSTVLTDAILDTMIKTQKIKFIDHQIMMIIGFMLHQLYKLETDM